MILAPEILLDAYTKGYFPMAESQYGKELHWFYPQRRGIIPLDGFHIPSSLAKLKKKNPFTVCMNKNFHAVIHACADIRTEIRKDTWINQTIVDLYTALHVQGNAHSVECYKNDVLVGGLYGVSIGGAFFGESMFSKVSGASKIALLYLVETLNTCGFTLLDTQYVNEHLKQFGVIEISRADYLRRLEKALKASPNPSMRLRMVSDIKSSTSGNS
jgi:leucyl/phenylalanyl-tRNA--protein transferase